MGYLGYDNHSCTNSSGALAISLLTSFKISILKTSDVDDVALSQKSSISKLWFSILYLQKGENPWLEGVVKDLSNKAGIPQPRLAIVNDSTPNAFVFGHTANDATLALHMPRLQFIYKLTFI
ncbi:MAG: M48 family metalloprotease [Nitrososphaerales archaeon]